MLALPPVVRLDLCAPVAGLLKEASRLSGEPMRVGPEIAGDTVYARFAGMPAAEVRARFAKLLHASWSRGSDGNWMLARSKEDKRDVARIERERLVADLKRGIEGLPVTPEGSPQRAAQEYVAGLQRDVQAPNTATYTPPFRGPSDGLLADLLRSLGPEGIADVLLAGPITSPVAFSDVPTARERPLVPKGAAALARYRDVDAAFGRAVGDELAESLDSWVRERLVDAARKVGVSRVLLILNRRVGLVQIQLMTFDAAGLERARAELSFDTAAPIAGDATGLPLPNPLPAGDGAAVAALTEPGIGRRPALVPYRDPVAHDPLEIRALPILRAMAGDALVALPDRVARETATPAMKTPEAFVATLARCGVRLRREGDLTLGEPVNPADFDRTCLDRAELRRWALGPAARDLAAVRSLGILYARGGPAVSYGGLLDLYKLILFRTDGLPRPSSLHAQLLRTIGTLTDEEWRALARGEAVVVGTPAARAGHVDELTRLGSNILDPIPAERGGKPVADVYRTGTAAFPKGLPPGTRLVLDSHEEPTFWRPDLKMWVDLGNYLYLLRPEYDFPAEITDETMARVAGDFRFDEARRTFLTFRLDFGTPVEFSNEMEEEAVRDVRRGVLYSELSQGARAAIRRDAAAFRDLVAKRAVKKP